MSIPAGSIDLDLAFQTGDDLPPSLLADAVGLADAQALVDPLAGTGAWKVAGDLPSSFRYAAQGLAYSIASQRNFRIHVFTGVAVFVMGLWLGLSPERLALLVLTVTAVLVLELLNTATEAVVDLAIGRQFHPLARIAKDCAAAAVLVAALSSLMIALLLLVPPLLARLGF